MKKVCFVVSHLGSGSGSLVAALNRHPQCQIGESGAKYDSTASFRWLFRMGHKCRDASAVYGDHLLFNSSISSREIYGSCRPILVIRPARHSLNHIIAGGYSPYGAASYYRFRIRRMCEIAKRSPGALLLTWDDLARPESLCTIKEYLGLSKDMPPVDLGGDPPEVCPERLVDDCQRAYDRYHYYLSRLELRRTIAQTS